MTLQECLENDPELLCIDGYFDDCAIGIANKPGLVFAICYSADRIFEKLTEEKGMSWEEALVYVNDILMCSHTGDRAPMFISYFDVAPVYEEINEIP